MCVFDCKCKRLKRLGENITKQKETYKKHKQLEEKQNKTKIQDIQPSTRPRKKNISKVPAGRFMFFPPFFICVVFNCKGKSLKRLGENKQTHKET